MNRRSVRDDRPLDPDVPDTDAEASPELSASLRRLHEVESRLARLESEATANSSLWDFIPCIEVYGVPTFYRCFPQHYWCWPFRATR